MIIFTDLDGTLLDENYSYEDALLVLNVLKKKKVPIIFCSGKTEGEQEVIKSEIGLNYPFIVEDGSAIYIPKEYFKEKQGEFLDNYEVIVLGVLFEK
ncbi:HAD hydrolase family protein, partial [Patescibacteria group bacterium]|nr:HAD hydrolase family protein [Patescibacteria group bacterium]